MPLDRLAALESATERALAELESARDDRAPAMRDRLLDVAEWVRTSIDADDDRRKRQAADPWYRGRR